MLTFHQLGQRAAANVACRLDNFNNGKSAAADFIASRVKSIVSHDGQINFAKAIELQHYVRLDLTPIVNSGNIAASMCEFLGGVYEYAENTQD